MTAIPARAWQVVLDAVERDLLDGRLSPGDHLPPERTLAADLGVGRSSVREALRVLEVLGLIRTAVGSGPSAGAIIVARPGGGMSALMRLQVAAQGFAVADVVKTRLVLEGSIVAELASGTGVIDLTASEQILTAMESQPLTEAEFLALDTQFHLSLAQASGNQVITATMAGLRSAIEGYARAGAAHLASWPATSARLMLEHRGILTAILAGQADAARLAVHAHISGYYAETHLASASTTTASPTTR
ncbi:FCD domain-containing protein [Cryobacterium sp. PH31-O1]|uniref:FadR/GntR family transcriptional regulator n=1 Tax=Cryobacterium sp. PH31-O1 TaxID=3046306 RepID=UPI0024BA8406|nr:FCD domain-containing protein [Cryobacterium sp. PH31-O1]MDJ0338767.1 FCD domain-containing protein [Cryobacterium sp. PH31-O1]